MTMFKILFLLFSVHVTAIGARAWCENGGYNYRGMCLYIHNGPVSYDDYHKRCKSMGSDSFGAGNSMWHLKPVAKTLLAGASIGFWTDTQRLGIYRESSRAEFQCPYFDVAQDRQLYARCKGEEDIGYICSNLGIMESCYGDTCVRKLELDTPVTQKRAQEKCKEIGGYLAQVNTEEKQSDLINILNHRSSLVDSGDVWIGASDELHEGKWRWSHTNKSVVKGFWADGEPNNFDEAEDCAIMDKELNYAWNDISCNAKFRDVLCEIPPVVSCFGDSCLRMVDLDTPSTQKEAQAKCRDIGGYLAQIDTEEKQKSASRIVENGSYFRKQIWIGASDEVEEGTWKWSHTNQTVQNGFWADREPNDFNGEEDCAVMERYHRFSWNDVSCNSKFYRALCEFPWSVELCFGDICLRMVDLHTPVTRKEAQEKCMDIGGYLAKIDTEEKQRGAIKILEPGSDLEKLAWIGASDKTKEGTWKWSHTNQTVDNGFWADGEPNDFNGAEDCGAMDGNHDFRWIDFSCNRRLYRAMCEIPNTQQAEDGIIG